jgi:hypothetical protein
MQLRPLVVSLSLGAVGLTACDLPPLYKSISRDEFLAQLPAAFCAHAAQCGTLGRAEEASCKSRLAEGDALVPIPGYSYSEALQAGRLRFDGVAAEKCLNYYRAGRCPIDAENFDNFTACYRLYRPQVPDGGACQINTECRSDTCTSSGPPGCRGVCAPATRCNRLSCYEDEYCSSQGACTLRLELGESCDPTLGPGTCQPGLVCQGSVCRPAVPAEGTCSAQEDCAPGLFCDSGSQTCKPRLAAGSHCPSPVSCQDGLSCVPEDRQLTSAVCKPVLDFPSACEPDLRTATAVCPAHAECDAGTRQCVERLAPGASCASEGCPLVIFYCDESTLTCQKPLAVGAACTPPASSDPTRNPCGTSGRCDPTTRKCVLACE